MSTEFSPKYIPGTEVIPVDAIALLSGVNYGSIVKVFAAMAAIADSQDDPDETDQAVGNAKYEQLLAQLVSMDAVPPLSAHASGYDRKRIAKTDQFVRGVIEDGHVSPEGKTILCLQHRRVFN